MSLIAAALILMPQATDRIAMTTPYAHTEVRLLDGPFREAIQANRKYLLALDADRLLAPFRREAGLQPKKPSYGNWESGGLDGHTAGHYLSALALMVANGDDPDGELKRCLEYMVAELGECQAALGTGYIGGVPKSKELWDRVAAGEPMAVGDRWVPWYNVHKTYAGLCDAYEIAGIEAAKPIVIAYANWADDVTSKLTDAQMQQMLAVEFGGMNDVFARVYEISRDPKHLKLARRFNHNAILDPLLKGEDRLTGLHANTQIPKVIGFDRIGGLEQDRALEEASRSFWNTVVNTRSVAFGGNSVSEHFNDPKNFRGLLEHREGPETCNTYNMLRLTEELFRQSPDPVYADYYERALYNHILASINTRKPGYVYFTPIRPSHYRVYSQPDDGFWCCVGTGMENPGRYGQFIYSRADTGVYVNLFIASTLNDAKQGIKIRQETKFPDEPKSSLRLELAKPRKFSLYVRRPAWAGDGYQVRINGKTVPVKSSPSSYVELDREWRNGDLVEVSLPMAVRADPLPDGSNWYAFLYGPLVLASPTTSENQVGLFAGDGRGDHIAHGPLAPMDAAPVLLAEPKNLPKHVARTSKSKLEFQIRDVVEPKSAVAKLIPFFRLHESRYQMYWEATDAQGLADRRARAAEIERQKLARDAATLDFVAIGEQQSEVDHGFKGDGAESGLFDGRRWRHGRSFEYTLNSRGASNFDLAVTFHGGDRDRNFSIFANGVRVAQVSLTGDKPGQFPEVRYEIPAGALKPDGMITIRFAAESGLAGGIYDVRLMRK